MFVVLTTIDGCLNSTGPLFSRAYDSSNSNSYYYQAIRVTVDSSNRYSFRSNSSIDTYGCVYESSFYPLRPYTNLLVCDDNSGSSQQFLINSTFQLGRIYILVVTTFLPSVTGGYSIVATGPDAVSMDKVPVVSSKLIIIIFDEKLCWFVLATKSGSLSPSNPTFTRPNSSNSNYYYESIEIRTLNKSGFFTFQSNSSTSTDLYGCLYHGWFDPSNSSINKYICDDNSGDDHQFQFSVDLYPSPSDAFTLVVTTSFPFTTGSYFISVTGPSLISMTIIIPSRFDSWSLMILLYFIL